MSEHEHNWVAESGRSSREVCLACGATRQPAPAEPARRQEGVARAAAPQPARDAARSPRTRAQDRLTVLTFSGLLLLLLGAALVVLNWPTEADDGSGLLLLGAVVSVPGYFLVGVGMVGFGVKLGREAALGPTD